MCNRCACATLLCLMSISANALAAPRLDFTIRVSPALDDITNVRQSGGAIPQMNWVEVVRSRIDRPEPPPPVVPAGLAGLVWGVRHPAEGWRVVLPIPPDQVPKLVLPADPANRSARLG